MKSVIAGLAASAVVAGLVGVGVGLAAPASAGCAPDVPGETYCDFPVRPNGTWERCHEHPGVTGIDGRVLIDSPPVEECYWVDPSQPGQIIGPHYHLD